MANPLLLFPGISTAAVALEAELGKLRAAAAAPNTVTAYRQDLRHYEQTFGGILPATPDQLTRYLATYAGKLAVTTLQRRLAAIARYARDFGYPDATKAPAVQEALKGARRLYSRAPRKATPLGPETLEPLIKHLEQVITNAADRNNRPTLLMALRNRALFLLGFWCGLRSDELVRLRVEQCALRLVGTQQLTLYLPHSKADVDGEGRSWPLAAQPLWCPVTAYQTWVEAAEIDKGPLFRRISKAGRLADQPLHVDSVIKLIRTSLDDAGIDGKSYSTHSLRHGFATLAYQMGASDQALMQWVGWKTLAVTHGYRREASQLPLAMASALTKKLQCR